MQQTATAGFRRKRKRYVGTAGLLAAIVPLLLLNACGGEDAKAGTVTEPPTATSGDPLAPMPLDKKTKVTFGLSSKLEAFAPALLADYFGEFEKENLDVEFKFIPPTDSTLLVAQGKLDVASGAFTAGTFNLVAAGSPLKFVYPGVSQPKGSTQGFWFNNGALNASDGLDADDFKGKKILTSSGDASPSAFQLYEFVKALPGGENLDAKDLEFESFLATDTAQAVESGAAAAGQINSPYNLTIEKSGCCTFLEGAIPNGRTVSAYFFGPTLEGRADVGAAIVRSLARTTVEYLPENYRDNETTMNALSEVLELDLATLEELPPLYWNPEFATDVEINIAGGQPFYRERGLLQYDEDIEADDLYDTRYLEAIGAGE